MGHTHEEKASPSPSPFDAGPALSLSARLHPSICTATYGDPLHTLVQPGRLAFPGGASPDSAMSVYGGMYDAMSERRPGRDLSPLTPAAGMAARGEFRGAPLRPENALRAYADFGAEDFVGADDMRINQINRVASKENRALQHSMQNILEEQGISDVRVYGRAKSPESLYGKLLEKPGATVGNIKDISGARVDINVNQPNFAQHYQVQEALHNGLGEQYALGKNYIEHPNQWGYTGRMHDFYKGENVPTHELQIGSSDLSKFIDWKATNGSGQSRSVHDLTGYKGELYGTKISPEVEAQYPQIMREIAANDGAGRSVAQNPELQTKISSFRGGVEEGLPTRFPEMPPAEVSKWTMLKRLGGRGLGGLGVVGGGLQAWQGAKELQHGKTVEGVADVGGGLTNVAAGGAMLLGKAALGTTLGGVAAGVDGVKDIYLGARDHNLEQAAVGGVKTAAGGMMLAGTATMNPLLVGAGALTYGGAVVYEHRDAIKNLAAQGGHWIGDKATAAWDGAKGLGHRVAGWF